MARLPTFAAAAFFSRQRDHVRIELDADGRRATARGGDHRAPVAGPEVDHVVLCGHVGHVEHFLHERAPVGTQTTSLPCWPTVGWYGAFGIALVGIRHRSTFASVVTVADFGGGGDVVIQKTNPIPRRAVNPTTIAA